jgi:HK97 family phage prohead protease
MAAPNLSASELERLASLAGGSAQDRFEAWARLAAELRQGGLEPPRWQGRIPRVEERSPGLPGAELRALPEGRLEGDVIVYDAVSQDLGGFKETVRKGAVTKTLREGDVVALWSHDTAQVLGRTSSGTLELRDTSRGVEFSLDLPDSQVGRDAWETVDRGDVKGTSFGFRAVVDRWTESKDPGELAFRELLEIDLLEVSPVAFPAYDATQVAARSVLALERHRLTCRERGCTCQNVRPRDLEPAPPAPGHVASLAHRRARLRLLTL